MHYALDRGINLYDTAEQYHAGQHEAYIGEAFKDVRDRVIVVDKHVYVKSHQSAQVQSFGTGKYNNGTIQMGFPIIDIRAWHEIY